MFLISDRSGQMRGSVETVVGATTSKSYFQLEQSMADSPESIPVVSQSEFNHIAHISSVDGVKLWATMNEGNRRIFKEADALWLFFYFIGHHLESHPSREKANITVRLWEQRICNILLNLHPPTAANARGHSCLSSKSRVRITLTNLKAISSF